VTSRLLAEREFAFRGVSGNAAALGAGTGKAPPSIGFLHKQVPKKEEETYGCDLALLVRGRVPGALRVESAELVQVKKPESGEGGLGGSAGFRNSWRIDTKQLADILEWSETAAYWLIDGSGEVFVVPARLLRGILEERGKLSQGSAAVPYSGIRAMAIPLPEFLVDLVIGLWIGTARDTTLRLARGETGSTRPRHIVEIEVRFGEQHGG